MKKNKSQASQSFPKHLSSFCSYSCRHSITSLHLLFSSHLISSTPPCLSGKDTPRAFGASFRRHAAPRTLVLTFFSLASIPLLRLSRTL